jgi:hypothetical protein
MADRRWLWKREGKISCTPTHKLAVFSILRNLQVGVTQQTQMITKFLVTDKFSYRFSRKIFWCVESLFHEKNTYERHQAMLKAAEHSPFELYSFLQSFFHSAPQVILNLFILLRDDIFRNYDTGKQTFLCHKN